MGRGASKGRGGGRGGRSKILHPSFASAGQMASGYTTPPPAPATPGWAVGATPANAWMPPGPQTPVGLPMPGTPAGYMMGPPPSMPMTPNYPVQGGGGFPGMQTPMTQPGTPITAAGYHQYYQLQPGFGPSVPVPVPGTPIPCHFAAPGTPMSAPIAAPTAAAPAAAAAAAATTPWTSATISPEESSDSKRARKKPTLAEVAEMALEVVLEKPTNLPRIWECSDIVVPRHIEALLSAARPCDSHIWTAANGSVNPPSLQEWADVLELAETPEISGANFSLPLREMENDWFGSHRERELMESRVALQAYCDEMLPVVGGFAVEQEDVLHGREAVRHQHDWSFEKRLIKPSKLLIEALVLEDRAREAYGHYH